jgi:hypothetical protein
LGSYVFQPNTANLFERLQKCNLGIQKIETTKNKVRNTISTHENTLGGMLECMDSACDLAYYKRHDKLQKKVDDCFAEFQKLKSKVFDYAGGILKKRKP